MMLLLYKKIYFAWCGHIYGYKSYITLKGFYLAFDSFSIGCIVQDYIIERTACDVEDDEADDPGDVRADEIRIDVAVGIISDVGAFTGSNIGAGIGSRVGYNVELCDRSKVGSTAEKIVRSLDAAGSPVASSVGSHDEHSFRPRVGSFDGSVVGSFDGSNDCKYTNTIHTNTFHTNTVLW